MTIKVTECEASGGNILRDIVNCAGTKPVTDVADWLSEILKAWGTSWDRKRITFLPLDLAVQYKGQWHYLVSAGKVSGKADAELRKIRRLPAKTRQIPNDRISITADVFERELFVNLDGEPAGKQSEY